MILAIKLLNNPSRQRFQKQTHQIYPFDDGKKPDKKSDITTIIVYTNVVILPVLLAQQTTYVYPDIVFVCWAF